MSTHHVSPSDGHVLDSLLAAYAAGSLPPAMHALLGAHLELNATNQKFVSDLEVSLARTVDAACDRPARNRESRLDAIFGSEQLAQEQFAACDAPELPRALRRFLGRDLNELSFKTVLPGIREHRVDIGDGSVAVLYRIRAGRKMPQHTHEGSEVSLVIRGGFSDATGHFVRGDVAVTDEHVDHVPVADADEECVCFAVIDAPLRLTGPIGRIFNRFIRH
ncbi:ChrR Transcriptional activator [Rhabdaerophilaceae bacterium]